ncbi:TonB-dependent receptor [Novosphingobium lentum]|uniref:TonB-dependent receptor n=1 Tax=Novosphingobium lentum TaxID=145287 RepID=UPI000829DAD9|nr:TonB-dependent receptor [Novosphingobium lentum]
MHRHIHSQIRSRILSGAALAAFCACATPAFAADAADAADSAKTAVPDDTIVVTARRTDEKLKDVPVAVAAFSTKALTEQRIASEADLQVATPGLTVRSTTSSNQLNYSIRGQSVDSFSYSSPAVVAYSNNVPVGGTTATSFFDLQSIQVLKGPQGTLFGRNATGGAVLYETAKPTSDFGGYLTAGYGNYSNREAEGAINIPLGSSFAIRLAGKTQQRDGFQNDLVHGNKLGSLDDKVGRVSVLIKPEGSGFENVFVYQRGEYGGYSTSLKIQNANGANGAPRTYTFPGDGSTRALTTNFADFYPAGVVLGNASPAVAAFLSKYGISGIGSFIAGYQTGKFGFYDVAPTQDSKHDATQDFISNTTSLKLGDATIKNIFGYNRVLSVDNTDLAGAPYSWLTIGVPSGPIPGGASYNGGYTYGTKQWSDELQISGTALDGKLKYVAGAFISQQKDFSRIPLDVIGDLLVGSVPGAFGFQGAYDFEQKDKSKAVYAQLSYELLPRLNVSAGIRYTKDDISISYPDPTGINSATVATASKSASKPSWLFGLDYKVTPDLLVYFNQRGSWRTGGFNGTAPAVANPISSVTCPAFAANPKACYPEAFDPETTYDFELGAKYSGVLGSVPTVLNIAIYDQEISNVQRSPYFGISAIAVNVPHARVRGIEIDGSVRPADWLQFGGAFTYTDAKYTSNKVVTPTFGTFFFGPYGDTPKYSGSAWFRASTNLPDDKGELALRGEVYAQSSFYYSNLANTTAPGTRLGKYALVKARFEWNELFGSKVSAAAYVNNLTNKKFYTGGISLSSVTGENAALIGAPRMYGFEISVKF